MIKNDQSRWKPTNLPWYALRREDNYLKKVTRVRFGVSIIKLSWISFSIQSRAMSK